MEEHEKEMKRTYGKEEKSPVRSQENTSAEKIRSKSPGDINAKPILITETEIPK